VPSYLLIPLFVLAILCVFFGLLLFLGRFRGGRYMRSIVFVLAKIPFMRRFFAWSQRKMTEKQNPELASVIRKLERLGPNPDQRQAQQVISRFTRAEKRAYDEYIAVAREQGALPEATNRQLRRAQQRGTGMAKPAGGGASPKKAGKRRR
jgi:hypothetical protein